MFKLQIWREYITCENWSEIMPVGIIDRKPEPIIIDTYTLIQLNLIDILWLPKLRHKMYLKKETKNSFGKLFSESVLIYYPNRRAEFNLAFNLVIQKLLYFRERLYFELGNSVMKWARFVFHHQLSPTFLATGVTFIGHFLIIQFSKFLGIRYIIFADIFVLKYQRGLKTALFSL